MRPLGGLMNTIIWRTCIRQTILKLLFLNETPRRAYENYHLEKKCSPNQIRNCADLMRQLVFVTKTIIWRT